MEDEIRNYQLEKHHPQIFDILYGSQNVIRTGLCWSSDKTSNLSPSTQQSVLLLKES